MKFLQEPVRRFMLRFSTTLSVWWPSSAFLKLMRKHNEIQLAVEELKLITTVLQSKPARNFLVFGLGNDSLFWSQFNHHGKTVFLEDDKDWFASVTKNTAG
jgi:hypothetical protein